MPFSFVCKFFQLAGRDGPEARKPPLLKFGLTWLVISGSSPARPGRRAKLPSPERQGRGIGPRTSGMPRPCCFTCNRPELIAARHEPPCAPGWKRAAAPALQSSPIYSHTEKPPSATPSVPPRAWIMVIATPDPLSGEAVGAAAESRARWAPPRRLSRTPSRCQAIRAETASARLHLHGGTSLSSQNLFRHRAHAGLLSWARMGATGHVFRGAATRQRSWWPPHPRARRGVRGALPGSAISLATARGIAEFDIVITGTGVHASDPRRA